jgi:hypothetical protein
LKEHSLIQIGIDRNFAPFEFESTGEIFQYDSFNNPAVIIGFIKEIKY